MLKDGNQPLDGDGYDDVYEEEGGVCHQDLKKMSDYKDSGQQSSNNSKTQKSQGNRKFPVKTLIWAVTIVSLISLFLVFVNSGTLDIKVGDGKIEINLKKNE